MVERPDVRRAGVVAIALLIAAVCARTAAAQPEPPPPPGGEGDDDKDAKDAKDVRAENATLKRQNEQLVKRIEGLEEDVEDLQDDLDDLDKQVQTPRTEPVRLNLLNPPITVFANLAARIDSDDVASPEGAQIDNKVFLRTAEIDFRAAIDPYADGLLILALEDQAGQGFEADIEEAYVILKRLPIFDAAPLGLKLKLGRFRAPIGSSNRLHMHDLPWTTRPLPIVTMLGTEHGAFFESGFNPEGLDAEMLLPTIIPGAVMELNVDVLDAGDMALSETNDAETPAVAGHYNLFFTAGESHDFNLGLSAYYEHGDQQVALFGADVLYKWKPLSGGEFRSFVLGGEVFYADREFLADTDGDEMPDTQLHSKPLAAYGFAQYQLGWHTYLGGRYDYAQDVADTGLATQVLAAYVSYYTSEFLRFRLGYEYRMSDVPELDGVSSGMLEVNYVIGSHPTEPYWVNR